MSLSTFAAPAGLDNWGTPAAFKAALESIYHFDAYDPCPINPEGLRVDDGLAETPAGVTSYFCNPPYSEPQPWLEKAIRDKKRGITGVYLLRVDTSTNWMHDFVFPYARPIWVRGRLRFRRHGPCQTCVKVYKVKADDPRIIVLKGKLHLKECISPKGHPSPFASVVAAYEPRVRFPSQAVMWEDKAGIWHMTKGGEELGA